MEATELFYRDRQDDIEAIVDRLSGCLLIAAQYEFVELSRVLIEALREAESLCKAEHCARLQ